MKNPARHLRSVPASSDKTSTPSGGERYLNQRDWEQLLTGSALLPVQYYDLIHPSRILCGEQKLMFAVLEDGIHEYLHHGAPRTFQEFVQMRELVHWFEAHDQSSVFSFESLCETFGIHAQQLWKSLQSRKLLQHDEQRTRLSHREPFAFRSRKAV